MSRVVRATPDAAEPGGRHRRGAWHPQRRYVIQAMQFGFDNTYARLPARFSARVLPTTVPNPRVIRVNRALAEELGLDPDLLASPEGAQVLSGNAVPDDADPRALAYA